MSSDSTTIRRSTIEQCACGEVIIGGECPACADLLEDLGSTQAGIYRALQDGEALAEELAEQTDYSYRSVTSAVTRLYKAGYIDRKRNPENPVQNIYFIESAEQEGSR